MKACTGCAVSSRKILAMLTWLPGFTDLKKTQIATLCGELKWLARKLGAVRDLDVFQIAIRELESEIPPSIVDDLEEYYRSLKAEWDESRKALLVALSSERYEQLKCRIEGLLEKINGTSKSKKRKGKNAFKSEVSDLKELLIDSVCDFRKRANKVDSRSPSEEIHDLRKRGKQMRYLFEFSTPVFGKPTRKLAKTFEALQENLGSFQDACIGIDRINAYGESHPEKKILALRLVRASFYQQHDEARENFEALWSKEFASRLTRKRVAASFKK